jgi:hypothetical protein
MVMRNQLVPRAWRVTLFAMLLALVGCNGPESSPQSGAAPSASKSQSEAPDGLGDLGLADFAGGVDAEFGVETFALGEPTLKIVFPVEAYRYEVDYTQTDPGDPGYNDQLDATQATLTFQVTNFAIGPTQGQILCWVDGQDPPSSTTSASLSNVVLGLQKGMRTITCTLANAAGEPLADASAKANAYVQVTSIFGDEAPENRCFNDSECDDGNACSYHACVGLRCDYKPDLTCCLTDIECTTGKVCLNPNTANALCSACTADLDCDDGDDCTTDTCDSAVTGACKNIKADAECCKAPTDLCDDGKACTVDSCDVANETCLHVIPQGACCADSDCASTDPCLVGVCVNLECRLGNNDFRPDCCGVDADCDDKNFCTLDKCETDMGGWTQCTHNPDPAKSVDATCCDVLNSTIECQDGNPCTYDVCNNYKCEHLPDSSCCAAAIDCDDGNPCTTDSCNKAQLSDPSGKCVNTNVGEIGGAPTVLPVTSGLAAHYDASNETSVIKDGSNIVSSWEDISGNGRHLTTFGTSPVYGASLLNGKPAINFGAAATGLVSAPFPLTAESTVFFVIRQNSPDVWGSYGHHGSRDSDWALERWGSLGGVQYQTNNDNGTTFVPLTAGTDYLLTGRMDASDRKFSVRSAGNTTTVTSGASTTLSVGNKALYIGRSDLGEGSRAYMAEIVYFDRALSDAEIDQVSSYLTARWSIGTAPVAGKCCVTASDCDDGKFCTTDTCNNGTSPTGGTCSYTQPDAACCDTDSQCDDGDSCTQQVCVNHGCYFGPDGFKPNCCSDNGDCNDNNPCTVDACNTTSETCEYVSNGDPTCCITNEACDDADCTTYDFCNSSNVCESKPDPLKCTVNSDCEDGDPCTINTCDTTTPCGQCKVELAPNCCASDFDCNDAVPSKAGPTPNPNAACTLDKCVNNVCENTIKENCCVGDTDAATICDDDNACTIEYCLANTCRHTAPKGGCCATNGDCNDGNTCTTDSCGPLGGDGKGACQYALQGGCTCTPAQVAAGTNCNDNNPCTADSCVGGLCVNSELAGCCVDKFDCNDGSPCTYDYCIFNQCVHSPTEAGAALCCSPATEAVDCAFKNTDCAKGVCKAQVDGSFQCESEQVAVCTVNIGYCQDFQQGSDLTAMGWNPGDVQGEASNNWKVAVDTGLGPDKAAKLDWTPTQINYETCLQSPVIQAAGAQQITLQYDHEFLWRSNETTVRLLGTLDGAAADWSQSVLINQWSLTDNMGPETIDLTLPPELTGSNGLRLAFCVSGATSFDMEAFSLDNICIVKGQKPTIPLCPGNQIVPYNTTKTIPLKAFDYDYEAILSFSLVQAPSFVSLSSAMYFWLDTSWNANLRIQPQALADVGTFPVTVKVSDGALYSLCTFNITVTYNGGYLVWRPTEVPEEMGTALATSIKTAVGNTPVQHISDLGLYDNLDGFAGVFVTLGVYPQNHVLNPDEAAKLSLYLASAGRLYMEGGETWFYDAQTSVHNLFSVSALADDAAETITGPLLGSNIYRDPTQDPPKIYQWGYNQAGEYNNLNDVIGPKSTAGTRQLLISNNPILTSGVQVGNNVPLGDYRTVASSILFAGVEASGPDVPNDMIKRILYFFDNGYVDCATAAQCDDSNDCTTDTCVTGECKHQNSCTCTSAGTIGCGDTLSVASNAVGSTQALSFYGCEPTTPYTGKEFAVSYVATSSAPVNVTISNLSNPAARIFVTKGNEGTCDPAQCIASGSTSFSFPGAAGQTYFVIIDVGDGGTATADISFSCAQGEDCGNGQDDNGNGLADCADLASCCGFAGCGELCDGADNDCNGTIDDGCDSDQDGYCDITMTIVGNPPVCSLGVGDCNDELATVHPAAAEICANGKDDNCSGGGDEEGAQGCQLFWTDLDNDTFGAGGSRCLCTPQGQYKATTAGDCNDANADVNPLETEICANGIDDDCTGSQNDQNALGCEEWYTDADLDGFGVLPSKCQCVASGTFQASQAGDCDDTRASSVPAGEEACNARDDDCDGLIDEGCDDDSDGYCDAGIGYEGIGEIVQGCIVTNNPTTLTCANGGTITAISKGYYGQPTGTCPGIGPGACNLTSALQTIKDLCLGEQSCVLAANTVTFGSDPCVGEAKSLAVQWTCTANGSPPPVCPQGGGDTDDLDGSINPQGMEICDNKDNNSDGFIDEGCDDDGDQFCDSNMVSIGSPTVCPKGKVDCDDTNADINPGEAEDCNTLADDDCDADPIEVDGLNCTIYFADGDMDGYGTKQFVCACGPSLQYSAPKTGDCNDTNTAIHPGQDEICDDVDTNCNGQIDDGCDDDGDGFCDGNLQVSSGGAAVCVNTGNDCDDTNGDINPSKAEVCGNGIDDNCFGGQNDVGAIGCTTFYADGDNDGFGSSASKCQCEAAGTFKATNMLDCDDTNGLIRPGATEICDGVDNNCNDVAGTAPPSLLIEAGSYPEVSYVASGFANAKDTAQSFVPNITGTLASVDLWVAYNYSPSASVYVGIATFDGSTINFVQQPISTIPPVSGPWSVTLGGGVPVVSGNTYHVVIYSAGAATDMALEAAGDVYAGGMVRRDTAILQGNWTEFPGIDLHMGLHYAGSIAVEGVDEGCNDDGDDYCDASMTTVGTPATCIGGGGDCNDLRALTNPGIVAETCDNIDDDCDGQVDDGCDDDGDGYCDAGRALSNPVPTICPAGGNDCDDLNNARNPGAQEVCANGLDDNCDGSTNNIGALNCKNFYFDGDEDSYGLAASICVCEAQGSFQATKTGDCNDSSTAVYPGAAEVCGDGIDNDCDLDLNDIGAQGCSDFYFDDDQDGYGLSALKQCRCVGEGDYTATSTGDCNDNVAAVKPGATEKCNNVDDNCAGGVDEGCNDDGDAYCDINMTTVGTPNVCALGGGDCDDGSAAVNPGLPEQCDDADNNCSGVVDEGCDDDNDNVCDAGYTVVGTPTTCTLGGGDCNDAVDAIYPGAGETCATLYDDDCDGDANDIGATGCDEYGVDADGDTFNDKTKATRCLCVPAGLYRGTEANDCNDQNDLINPGIIELCDGIDNDCDGTVDEQCDVDDDGYCDAARTTVGKPAICAQGGGDCNDANAAINPGIAEVCGNAVDENCDAQLNSIDAVGCTDYYLDSDNDTYAVNVKQCWCVPTGGYKRASATPADCDDTSALTNPGASEVCGDSMDNDCDGSQNDQNAIGCSNFFADADKDGFGTGSSECRCFAQGTLTTSLGGDCNDAAALINPGEVEGCDGIDNNCNGTSGMAILDQLVSSTSQTPQAIGAVTYGQQFQVGQTGKLHSVRFLYRNTGASAAATVNVVRAGSTIATAALTLPAAASFVEFTATFATKPSIAVGEAIRVDLVPTGTLTLVSLARDNAGPYSRGAATTGGTAISGADFRFSTYVSDVATTTDEGCDDDNDDYCDAQLITTGTPAVCPNGTGDCNDNAATIKPLAAETCNNIDDNCQGLTDEGCDDDNDQYCDANMTRVGTPTVCTLGGNDCDDGNAQVHSAKAEVCDNVDNNCNGQTDEGCDDDNDDYCDSAMTVSGNPTVCPNGPGDCADTVAARNPGAAEVCDNVDNNCAGGTDETCVDTDLDGYCVGSVTAGVKCPNGGGDCDDTRAAVNPGATETCGTALDDDCDGLTNEVNATLCQNFYTDADNDGFGTGVATCQCAQAGGKTALVNGDCADGNANVNPTKLEICDGIDNDCAGTPAIDGGCDDDGDTFCDGNLLIASTATCAGSSKPAVGTTKPGDDCNDASSAVKPGAAELCDNLDNGCNGFIDEGCDDDNDNYCDAGMTRVGTPGTCTVAGADCNDTNALINPSRQENCTTPEDDNCDGSLSSINALGCVTYYQDGDNDTWGSNTSQCLCAPAAPFTATKRVDCNDGDAAVFPSASAEICDNKDNNCNGVVDEGCDIDKDGYCAAGMTVTSNQACTSNAIGTGQDCGPQDKNVAPGKPELCNNVDDNCNGNIDEGCDDDNDNYCDAGMTTVGSPTTCTAGGGDCNDANANVRPAGTETCDSVDNNCNGLIDEVNAVGCSTRYYDGDQDGFGVNSTICACAATGLYSATNNTDCNDACPTCKPGGGELICDGLDNNCTGGVDEGCNADGDPFCTSAKTTIGKPSICNGGGGDCNDANASIYPSRAEACNGVDDDCDLTIDEQAQDVCPNYPNATRTCVSGGCVYACLPGFSNNNGGWGDGCEVRNF